MSSRHPAEQYGPQDYDDDWEDDEGLEAVPEWLTAFGKEDFELMAGGIRADIIDRLRLQGRIAEEAVQFQAEADLPDHPGMTGAEESMIRIVLAAGRAATEFVDETLRRHHDPGNPLRIDPTAAHRARDENDLDTWRAHSIIGLQHYCVREARTEHTERYGFAIVTGEAIEAIREAVGDTPIVEIGAGNAWLARELCERGLTVFPTDPAPLERNEYRLGGKEHMPVERLDGFEALEAHPDCDLLWSWPQMQGYVPEVMRRFQGKHLAYIGENGHGCTGPREDIVVTMEGRYRDTGRVPLPSFPEVNDNLYILERIDYELEPAGRDSGEYPAGWGEQIQAHDLDRVLQGPVSQDLAERIVEAALNEGRIQRELHETGEENLRRNLEFSIPHIARATVSDAMRYGNPELRDSLEDELLENDIQEREWAEARVDEICRMAEHPAERIIRRETQEEEER